MCTYSLRVPSSQESSCSARVFCSDCHPRSELSTAYRMASGSPQDDEPPAAAAALLINICRRYSSLSLQKVFSSLRKILLLLVFCVNRSWPRPGKREIFRAQSKATFGRDRHATFWIPWQVVESVWTIPPRPARLDPAVAAAGGGDRGRGNPS